MTDTQNQQHHRVKLWEPTQESREASRMAEFTRFVNDRHGLDLPIGDYRALHTWTVENLNDFWQAVWDFSEVIASAQPEAALTDLSMPTPAGSWFPGATLNFAENMLRHAATRPDEPAIIGEHETADRTVLTWQELSDQVASLAAYLRGLGVGEGDRIVGILPNIPETVVALLATASLGATWAVVNTDFGPHGVADRFAQLEPTVLLTVDGYCFGGTQRHVAENLDGYLQVLPTVKHVVVIDQSEGASPIPSDVHLYSTIIQTPAEHDFAQVPFDHPLWVLFSSGTTGKPKGIVQSQGGILLEFLKALGIQASLEPEDIAYFAVATTWMVWNMHIGILFTGAAIIVYDGAPTYGAPDKSFEIIARNRATFFGTGAGVLTMIQKAGIAPGTRYDLSSLKAVLVTGSPLPDSTWDWVYDAVESDLRLSSDSGGTDVCSAFVGGNPFDPVYRGIIAGAYLGVNVEAWDPHGEKVINEVGEFVVTTPGPSMPIFFWNDEDGSRLRGAYFEHYPNVWRHGDWTTELPEGGYIIHGRSDSTINRGGIRMGSADITQVVDSVEGVTSSMVIGAELSDGDYYMPLFVVPNPGVRVDDELKAAIVTAIRTEVSPRYVPDEIIEAPGLPRTRTGKLLEVPLKKIYQGADPSTLNRATVDDTETLDWFADHAQTFARTRAETAEESTT